MWYTAKERLFVRGYMMAGKYQASLFIIVLLALAVGGVFGQSASVSVDGGVLGPQIGKMHYGIFYEEINHAGDAGLWAELISNRSFENATTTEGWTKLTTNGAAGTIATDTNSPYNTYNQTELAVTVSSAGGGGRCGVYNTGYYNAMPITSGKSYNCVILARKASGFTGSLSVRLEDSSSGASNYYTISNSSLSTTWTKFSFTLAATRTLSAARLAITTGTVGTFYLSFVSLVPADAVDGFRPDLLQKLKDLKPGFVRFPGGCYVEGDVLANAWYWKGGVGPQEGRRTHWNLWGYWNTNGLGLYEYLLLCEKLGAEPLLVMNVGMAHGDNVTGTALQPYLQDALDAIEFANGDTSSTWGSQRATMGHPAPFNLKYLEIGNENGGAVYDANYAVFYSAIKAQYPYMNLVANVPVSGQPLEIVDEHYYTSPDWFASENHHYDNYSRTGPKIYVGEYAVTQNCGLGNLAAGLGEAMWMMGMERNSDVVTMCSYAPLFVNMNNRAWNPDLIGFDPSSSYGIPSYYVQRMMSENKGDVNLKTTASGPSKTMDMTWGGIGVGTWNTSAEFADVVVTNGQTTLYQSNFAVGTSGWTPEGGTWAVSSGNLQQTATAADCRDVYYAPTWTDYTLTLKARKISGSEGFLILFRAQDHSHYYWWNIGGWGNTATAVERVGTRVSNTTADTITTNVWYYIKIVAQGKHYQCYLKAEGETDYRLIHDFTDDPTFPGFDAVASRDNTTGDVLVKIVNRTNLATVTPINIVNNNWRNVKATVTTLSSDSDQDENSLVSPTRVSPQQTQLTGLMLPFNYNIQPYSLTIFRVSPSAYFTITASAGTGGAISPSGSVSVPSGGSQTFTFSGNQGFGVQDVLVDGVSQGAIVGYTFDNITANHSISVTFKVIPTFTITASAGANGTITPSGTITVNQGESKSFTISPNLGYQISQVTVDGANQGAISTYTFTNIQANHTISAVFTKLPDAMAYYKFDETSGTSVSDSSGNSKNGTATGGYTWAAGRYKNAISLNGSSGYVVLPTGLMSSINDFTISAWVYLNANSTWNRIFDFGTLTATYMFLSPNGGAGKIRYAIKYNGSAEQLIDGTAALPTGSWQHVAVTLSGTTGRLYVNGVQVGQNTNMTLKPSSLGNTTQTWIGRSQYADPYFNGLIDEFKIYNRALSATEILAQYNTPTSFTITASAGAGGSISPSGNVVVNYGLDQAFSVTPNSGYAITSLSVDGVSQGVINSFTFANVTANHAVSASFAAFTKPYGMNNRAALSSVALNKTIKVWGRIKSRNGTASFVISDGSTKTITVNGTVSASDVGKYATVTGIAVKDGLGQVVIQPQNISVYP